MNVFPFALQSLVRQPARSALGILGVAAVGALLFDMLLLSQGLLISMRQFFDRMGFDVRVMATDTMPGAGGAADLTGSAATAASIAAPRPNQRNAPTDAMFPFSVRRLESARCQSAVIARTVSSAFPFP